MNKRCGALELGTAPDGAIRTHYGLRMRECDFWRRYVEAGSPLPNATTVDRNVRKVEAERRADVAAAAAGRRARREEVESDELEL